MNQGSENQRSGKEKAAAWISGRPLVSVAAAASVAFFLGVGAGTSDASDQGIATSETAYSSTDAIEDKLDMAEQDLEDSLDAVADLRSEKRALQKRLSTKSRSLRQARRSLSDTRSQLSQTRNELSQAQNETQSPSPAAEDPQPSGSSGGSGSECDPNYSGTCVPNVSYDLNCDDIAGSVTVVGSDPHGFDGDGDGSGCE
ncbi:MAG: hypothetical protein ACRDLB_12175 [Actinomycetota bacterium]